MGDDYSIGRLDEHIFSDKDDIVNFSLDSDTYNR